MRPTVTTHTLEYAFGYSDGRRARQPKHVGHLLRPAAYLAGYQDGRTAAADWTPEIETVTAGAHRRRVIREAGEPGPAFQRRVLGAQIDVTEQDVRDRRARL